MVGVRRCLSVVVALALGQAVPAEDWPRFRGPNGSGVAAGRALPVRFGPEQNREWSTAVPFGRSSPVLGGELVFLTAVEESGFTTLALDRASGAVRWRRTLPRERTVERHRQTDSSVPSPVTDGANVYVFFPETGLASYGAGGEERWRRPLGPFRNFYGIAASPILAGDAVLLLCDQAHGSFLIALDRDTGAVRWRRERPGRRESYTTPVLYPDAEAPRLVLVAGSKAVDAYRVDTGEPVWTLDGVGAGPVSSPVLAGDRLFISAPDHTEEPPPPFAKLTRDHDADGDDVLSRDEVAETWMANHFGWIDVDGNGTISRADWETLGEEADVEGWGLFGIRVPAGGDAGEPEILWNHRRNVAYIPSPVVVDGVLFTVDDSIVTSLDAATGAVHRRGRLPQGAKVHASPVAADGKVYVATLQGDVVVLSAEAHWSVLAVNPLGEEILATPAIAGDRLYVRTRSRLTSFALETPEGAE